MSINYTEKGVRFHEYLARLGHKIRQRNSEYLSDDDVAVQALLDNYDPLPEAKADARDRVKQKAAELINDIYPHIDPVATDVIGFYNYTIDMWGGGALPSRLQQFKDVRDTALAKIAEVNDEPDYLVIEAYDATVGW